ncbi:hypothetical protein [Butyrivibrio sp. WCE2006]|uniref:hypothetical protein n=1 Tax=Butyrivibrio sp. WCE2006 TaxID=1410611 RepID=UPI0005D1D0F0|nr:hypothetical protein [Butyrivibrio sp. WCE2006]
MKNKLVRKTLTVAIAGAIAVMTMVGCGSKEEQAQPQDATVVSEEVQGEDTQIDEAETPKADNASEEEDYTENIDDEIQAVQDTLVFMGGLKTADDAEKSIDIAMFRNDQGDIIYIYEEDGSLDYGIYTTEDATTEDGREYAKITGSDKTYGYYFNEDLTTGIIVDTTGKVFEAVELDETAAREYVAKTIGG